MFGQARNLCAVFSIQPKKFFFWLLFLLCALLLICFIRWKIGLIFFSFVCVPIFTIFFKFQMFLWPQFKTQNIEMSKSPNLKPNCVQLVSIFFALFIFSISGCTRKNIVLGMGADNVRNSLSFKKIGFKIDWLKWHLKFIGALMNSNSP